MRTVEVWYGVGILAGSILAGLVLSAAFAIGVSILDPSQPPPPTEAESGQVPEQLAAEPEPERTADDGSPQPAPSVVLQDEAEPSNRPHNNQADPQQGDSASNRWDPITIFTGVLTIVALFQLRLLFKQSGIMRNEMEATRVAADAAKETVEQMRLEQRAWVAFLQPELAAPKVGTQINCNVVVKNTGATPAFVERQRTGIFLRPRHVSDLTDDFLDVVEAMYSDEPFYEQALPPGNMTHQFGGPQGDELTPDQAEQIEKERLTIVVIGIFVYRDIFDVKHGSVCCFKYRHAANRFLTHRKYNYMT